MNLRFLFWITALYTLVLDAPRPHLAVRLRIFDRLRRAGLAAALAGLALAGFAGTLHSKGNVPEKGPSMTGQKEIYEIDLQTVPEAEFRRLLETLHGKDEWYCKETPAGGITGWISSDPQGRRYRIRLESGGSHRQSITRITPEGA